MIRIPRNVPVYLPATVVLTGLSSVLMFSVVTSLETDLSMQIAAQVLSVMFFFLQVALFL